MYPNEAGEVGDADHDPAYWEETDECQGRESAVSEEDRVPGA